MTGIHSRISQLNHSQVYWDLMWSTRINQNMVEKGNWTLSPHFVLIQSLNEDYETTN